MRPKPPALLLTLSLLLTASAFAGDAPEASREETANLRTRTIGNDWERFLGPRVDGRSQEKIRTDWGEDGPPVVWFQKVGEGYSAPSILRGRLFIFDHVKGEARLTAVRSETGEKLWREAYATAYEDYFDYSVGPRTTPLVDGESVYVFGVEGRLRAHHVADGRLLWEIDTEKRYGVVQNFFGVGSTPVVEGDLLIVQIGGSPPRPPKIHSGEVKGNGTGIVAFDKRTGEERWRITDELASYASPVVATIGGRRRGFAFTRGGLVGFEPTKGKVDFFFPWRARTIESVNAATPVVVGDTVFVTESYGPGGALVRVTDEGYELIWKDPPRGKSLASHWATPVYHDGVLYGCSGQSSGEARLRAFEHRTGKVLWSVPGLGRSTLLYADGHFLVLTEYGRLLLIKASPERYELVAEHDFGSQEGKPEEMAASSVQSAAKTAVDDRPAERPALRFPAWNAPVLAHGYLYLRGKDQLICLDLAP